MATLSFKGKTFVQNHHLSVKYHQLIPKKDKSLTDKVSLNDNLIIHGDNLIALKALLPTYAGKVKCIYIDPPYNTGNEKWIYNDNVNSPMMQEWLGKVVDKEDFTRHDKWLCMMMPRLKLLRELLREDGVIFVSIDNNEIQHLRMLMDEIFGEGNFVEQIIWKNKYGAGAKTKGFIELHEYILCYSKKEGYIKDLKIPLSEKLKKMYNKKDEKYGTRGPYATWPLETTSMDDRENLQYPIKYKGKEIWPKKQWLWSKERVEEAIKNNEIIITEKNGKYSVRFKGYLYDEQGKIKLGTPISIYDGAYTQDGTKELVEIFGEAPLTFPKPTSLIKYLIGMIINGKEEKDSIILDSFAGSGTTAHAVLDLNKEDDGNRKFILVECEDYADRITAERVRRVIKGVKSAKDEKHPPASPLPRGELKGGLGGTFSYFELGDPIEMESILEGKKLPDYMELARYIFYTATGEEFNPSRVKHGKNFIGETKDYEIYLFYEPDIEKLKKLALTLDTAKKLGSFTGKKRLVFAPAKYLDLNDADLIEKHGLQGIEYCQLPFEIYKIRG